jgi:hypothetical protein
MTSSTGFGAAAAASRFAGCWSAEALAAASSKSAWGPGSGFVACPGRLSCSGRTERRARLGALGTTGASKAFATAALIGPVLGLGVR